MTNLLLLLPLLTACLADHFRVKVLDGARQQQTLQFDVSSANGTATVSWEQPDGPIFTTLLHVTEHLQAHFVLLLPELDLGESHARRLCLLSHSRVQTVPISSMVKLRESNSGLPGLADEDRGVEMLLSTRPLRPAAQARLPAAVRHFCASADKLLMPEEDAHLLFGAADEVFVPGPPPALPCHLSPCLLWFPCALNGCDPPSNPSACRVKACRQCFRFEMETAPGVRCP